MKWRIEYHRTAADLHWHKEASNLYMSRRIKRVRLVSENW